MHPIPGCSTVSSSVPDASSRQMKGEFLGTPGGAEPPLTPIVTALTPSSARIGTALRVKPGTSRCVRPGLTACIRVLHGRRRAAR